MPAAEAEKLGCRCRCSGESVGVGVGFVGVGRNAVFFRAMTVSVGIDFRFLLPSMRLSASAELLLSLPLLSLLIYIFRRSVYYRL